MVTFLYLVVRNIDGSNIALVEKSVLFLLFVHSVLLLLREKNLLPKT